MEWREFGGVRSVGRVIDGVEGGPRCEVVDHAISGLEEGLRCEVCWGELQICAKWDSIWKSGR